MKKRLSGRWYTRIGRYERKAAADRRAEHARKAGMLARVVPERVARGVSGKWDRWYFVYVAPIGGRR